MSAAILAIQFALLSVADPCETAKTLSPVGVVRGRVVSKAGTPRSGVRIRATIAGNGREVSATSNAEGGYVLAALDVGADVELTYGDASGRMAAGCWVRIARETPTRSVDVVLDDFRVDEVTPSVGCQDVSPNDSWVSVGNQYRLVVGDIEPKNPAPLTAQPVSRFDLRASDIDLVHFSADGASVRLAPAAQRSFGEFTEANVGRVCVITIEGLVASARATVQGPIRSGMMLIGPPALRGRLCDILKSAAHPPTEL